MNEKQNISKTSINTAFSVFGYKKSTRRDSNPRPSPWQGDTPPLSHSCILPIRRSIHYVIVCCFATSTRRDSNPRPSPWQGDTPPLSHSCILPIRRSIHYVIVCCFATSTRRDSNPRPSPWQGDTPPLSHSCISLSDNRLSQAQVVFYRKACDLSTTFFYFFYFCIILLEI